MMTPSTAIPSTPATRATALLIPDVVLPDTTICRHRVQGYPPTSDVPDAQLSRHPLHFHLAAWIGVIWTAGRDRVLEGVDVGFCELADNPDIAGSST